MRTVDTHRMAHFTWYGLWENIGQRALPNRLSRILWRWMNAQRWFLEKHVVSGTVRVHKVFPVEVENQLVWWYLFESPTANGRYYQLPLVLLPDGKNCQSIPIAQWKGAQAGYLCDAWSWPAFSRWFFDRLADKAIPTDPHLQIWRNVSLNKVDRVQLHQSEQSNTSIQVANQYFMKVIRIVQPGEQPEEEMGQELTVRKFKHSIPLLAGASIAVENRFANVSLVSPLVPNQGNGWEWLLEELQKYSKPQDCMAALNLLGQRTAELHQCLSLPTDNPSFSTESYTQEQAAFRIEQLTLNLQNTVRILSRFRTTDQKTKVLVADFKQLAGCALLRPFNIPTYTNLTIQRIHSDYHLGQVLRTDNDWLIIDFEGEPLRSLAERRSKDLPWRDVAGMLRSIDYAINYSTMKNGTVVDAAIAQQLSNAFLDGYQKAMNPNQQAAMIAWLPVLLLEKALYEIDYELLSRRDWLSVPLQGANQLLRVFS